MVAQGIQLKPRGKVYSTTVSFCGLHGDAEYYHPLIGHQLTTGKRGFNGLQENSKVQLLVI